MKAINLKTEHLVNPLGEMICFMFITSAALRISSGGQLAPAMMPVRMWEKSVLGKSGWFIMAMNMVGTPLKVVIRSWLTQARAGLGEK